MQLGPAHVGRDPLWFFNLINCLVNTSREGAPGNGLRSDQLPFNPPTLSFVNNRDDPGQSNQFRWWRCSSRRWSCTSCWECWCTALRCEVPAYFSSVMMRVMAYHPVCKCAKHAGHFIWSELHPLSPVYHWLTSTSVSLPIIISTRVTLVSLADYYLPTISYCTCLKILAKQKKDRSKYS